MKEGGISLGTILFIVFLILKLTETIDWSWWWVTAPLWIPVAIVVAFLIIVGFIVLVYNVLAQ
jgi:hypothetical protein